MKVPVVCVLIVLLSLPLMAQQTEVNCYGLYTGFDYMVSPARNLTERGFDVDFGVSVRRWLALGADFGALGSDIFSGKGTINGADTVFAPLLTGAANLGAPPPSAVNVPFSSTTYTFAAGPQFYLRRWKPVTFFFRPGLGMIHEKASLSLDPQIGGLLALLGATPPAPNQSDTQVFFGAGGGFDLDVSRPVAIRFTADWVNTHLFSNLLPNRQNYLRVTVGPAFRWGWRALK
jgi:hypothetical protein